MIAIVGGDPGGFQQQVVTRLTGSLWIASDQLPPDAGWTCWQDQPWTALAAWADRLAHPELPSSALRIATVNGFRGPATRTPVLEDHTEHTLAASAAIVNGQLPDLVVIASLSRLYEQVQAEIGSSVPANWGEKAMELAQIMASNAIDHFVWDLQRSSVPVICTAWTRDISKHKPQLVLPRAVYQLADLVVLYDGEQPTVAKNTDRFDQSILEVLHAL